MKRAHTPQVILSIATAMLGFSGGSTSAAIQLDATYHLRPGDRSYLTTGNTERGLALRADSGSLLLASRAGAPNIYVIGATTGADRHSLDVSGVGGGLFPLNKVAVAADGVVFAANMTISAATSGFKIYRWPDDSPGVPPTVAYEGNPSSGQANTEQRWGDTLDVRGSGVNTQIIAGSNTTGIVALFTTTDGTTFTPTIFSGVADGDGSTGLAFGPGNSFYTKKGSADLRRATFDIGAGTATVETVTPAGGTAVRVIGTDVASSYLATISLNRTAAGGGTTPDVLTIRNITNPAAHTVEATSPLVLEAGPPPFDNDNVNGAGAVVFGNESVFVLSTNNGLFGFSIEEVGIPVAPSITTPPAGITVLEGAIHELAVEATGDQPLDYQWTREGMDIPGAKASVYLNGPVTALSAGAYAVRVSNGAGAATSADAQVIVLPRADSPVSSPRWTVPSGSRPYLGTTSRTHRGLGVNPQNGHVLVATRELGTEIRVLDGQTGADLHALDTTGVIGGIFPLNMVALADDGAVFACNLTLDGTTDALRLYRWDNDSPATLPAPAFAADPANGLSAQRWGDTMDVRGSGTATQIVLGSRNGDVLAVLTTTDGVNFNSTLIQTDAPAGDFGLGLSFGEGDTVWGTSSGRGLRQVAFQLPNGSATTTRAFNTAEFPGGATAIAVDPELQCLAALVLDLPNSLQLFDISNPNSPPVRLDQELFNGGRVRANTDGTGAVAFGNGTVVGLATNHGVLALDIAKTGPVIPPRVDFITYLPPNELLLNIIGEPDASYRIETSPDLAVWTDGPSGTLNGEGEASLVLAVNGSIPLFARVIQTVP